MPKYSVTIPIYSFMTVEVEADNKKEAINKALDDAMPPCLCHQCSDDLEVGEIAEDLINDNNAHQID